MWSMNKDSSFKSGKDRIMKTKSSNNTLYVITAIASVVVILLAAVGFTNVEAQKVERVSVIFFSMSSESFLVFMLSTWDSLQ